MGLADVAIWAGASGCRGVTTTPAPAGIPTAAVRFWTCTGTSTVPDDESTEFEDLRRATDNKFAAELQMGLNLDAAGRELAIVKIGLSNTECSHWLAGAVHDIAVAHITDASAALPAEFPGSLFRYHFCWFLGATDAGDVATLKEDIEDIRTLFSGLIGAPFFSSCVILQHADSTIVAPDVLLAARAQIRAVSNAAIINIDDQPLEDTIHLTGGGQNVLGARLSNTINGTISITAGGGGSSRARPRAGMRRRIR